MTPRVWQGSRSAREAWNEARARHRAEKPAQPIVGAPRCIPRARRLRLKLRKKRERQWRQGVRMLIRVKRAIASVETFLATLAGATP